MNCVICNKELAFKNSNRTTCSGKCRKALKSRESHKEQRQMGWVRARSRLLDRFRLTMRDAGIPGPYNLKKYLRCSTRRFKTHFQNLFKDWESWDNYGYSKKINKKGVASSGKVEGVKTWVIEHTLPVALFDLHNEKHLRVLWSLENLRPLEHIENLQKHDTLDHSAITPKLRQMALNAGIQLPDTP